MVSYYLYINPDSTVICDLALFVTGYDSLYGFSRPQHQRLRREDTAGRVYNGLTAETATEAIVEAVIIGGDTDTLGAVTGGVAGFVLELNHFLIND